MLALAVLAMSSPPWASDVDVADRNRDGVRAPISVGPVAFVPLDGRSRVDCVDAATTGVCRVRRNERIEIIDRLLQSGESLLRDGNELLFVHRQAARSVSLRGGLQYPLSRVDGTDDWVVRLRVPDLDRLVLSYAFAVDEVPPPQGAYAHWRGMDAPAAVAVSSPLQGGSEWISVASVALPKPRRVYVYLSPDVCGEPIRTVVYLADGKYGADFARVAEPLVLAGAIPRLLIVGVEAASGRARNEEYVPALGAQSGRFDAHQRFVVSELIPYVEHRYGVLDPGVRRTAAGFSNGADWAIATGLRHPRLFAHVVAFAAGWPASAVPADAAGTSFDLGAGTLDRRYHRNTRKFADRLASAGMRHHFAEVVGGHDMSVWMHLLAGALRRAMPASECSPSRVTPATGPESTGVNGLSEISLAGPA